MADNDQVQAATVSVADEQKGQPATVADRPKNMPEGFVDTPAPSRAARITALLDGYAHAFANNGPRTQAELDEMRALLSE